MSVESAMECTMRVDDVLYAVSSSGTMRSAMSVLLENQHCGKANAVAIFLLPRPWAIVVQLRRIYLCGAHHKARKMLFTLSMGKTCCFVA